MDETAAVANRDLELRGYSEDDYIGENEVIKQNSTAE